MAYNELVQHGTEDFPIGFYHIDKMHPRYEMVHHWHTQAEIIRVKEGKIHIMLNNREYYAKPGDVVFVNCEVIHGAHPDEGCVYECIVFDLGYFALSPEAEEFINKLISHDVVITEYLPCGGSRINEIADELFDTASLTERGYKFAVTGLIFCLLGEIQRGVYFSERLYSKTQNAKSTYKLKKVLRYIQDSYSKHITLADMADAAGISPKYFCSFFKSMTSKTPFEYLNSYRVERACGRLLGSDDSVTDIAYACGFNDLSYFIKVFKDEKGISPKKFRDNEG